MPASQPATPEPTATAGTVQVPVDRETGAWLNKLSASQQKENVRKYVTYAMVALFTLVELGRVGAAVGAMAWADGTWADVQSELGGVSAQVITIVAVVIGFYFGQQTKPTDG